MAAIRRKAGSLIIRNEQGIYESDQPKQDNFAKEQQRPGIDFV